MSITVTVNGKSDTYPCPLCDPCQGGPWRTVNSAALCDDHTEQVARAEEERAP